MEINRVDKEKQIQGEKRQRFPYILEWNCPECGKRKEHDFREHYLSYPIMGEPEEIALFCMDCDDMDPVAHTSVEMDVTLSINE